MLRKSILCRFQLGGVSFLSGKEPHPEKLRFTINEQLVLLD